MVTLTIDGIKVSVERGASILEAAQKAGVGIPTLCHDKRLVPYGACRLCVVEVTTKGRTKTMPACFNPARDGMEVATHTDKLVEIRRMQLMLLLRSHPLLCPNCDAAGDCRLQDLVHEYRIPDLPFERDSRYYHTDNDSRFIRHNMNLCIKCGMCARICDEVQGENELSFIQRGISCEISTDFGRPLDCEFCGQCAEICPVAAIRPKWLVGTGRDFELKRIDTTCSFCSLGCTLTLGVKGERIVKVTSPADSPNEGNLCVKGRFGWPYVYSENRLKKPLIRKDGSLQEVEWDEALSFVADNFKKITAASGGASIAGLGSERLTNEESYLFNRFMRTVIGTPHLDHSAGLGYRPLVDVFGEALGYPAGTNSIREIRKSQVILLLGADLTETHPVAKNEVIVATGRHRAKAIVVDAVQTKLTERKDAQFLHVRPGTEYIAVNGMIKWIIDQESFDKSAVTSKCEGFDQFVESLGVYDLASVTGLTGADEAAIIQAAKTYASASTATIVMTLGIGKPNSLELAKAAVNLALITGRIGKYACGIHVFGEKANFQGSIDMGLAPDLLPGFKKLTDDAARAKFEKAWGAPVPKEAGYDARDIIAKSESGEIRGLYIVGENPVETYPERAKLEQALAKTEFLVVQDMFLTSTAKLAHAVLPVKSFAEKTGTYTSAERMIQRLQPIMTDPGLKSDLEIFAALASSMGKVGFDYKDSGAVLDEIADLVEVYKGISSKRVSEKGLQWPCADESDSGKSILYEGGFPGGKAKLLPAATPAGVQINDSMLFLIPGVLKFHSGSFSTWSSSLMDVSPGGYAEIAMEDAKKIGLKEEDAVLITASDGTTLRLKTKISYRVVPGSIIIPQHFPDLKLNKLFTWDLKAVQVRVEKAAQDKEVA